MCQSESNHETNILVSFFPVFASIWVGSFSVFLVTSIAGAGYDLLFVILQRYNRDRVLKTIKRKRFSSVSSHLECQEEEKINYDYEGK